MMPMMHDDARFEFLSLFWWCQFRDDANDTTTWILTAASSCRSIFARILKRTERWNCAEIRGDFDELRKKVVPRFVWSWFDSKRCTVSPALSVGSRARDDGDDFRKLKNISGSILVWWWRRLQARKQITSKRKDVAHTPSYPTIWRLRAGVAWVAGRIAGKLSPWKKNGDFASRFRSR
jgi:hypothetical protein